MQTECNDPRLF